MRRGIITSRLRALTRPTDRDRPRDAGDTLVEIVVALAIISLAAVALLGGFLGSTSASATHRNMTTLDGVLKSFSESARYQIQTQPNIGSSGPQFVPCASYNTANQSSPYTYNPYRVVASPYPTSGPTGSWVTFFGLGFPKPTNASPPKLVNTSNGQTTLLPLTAGQFTYSGDVSGAIVSYEVPSGLANSSYTVYPFDGTYPANGSFTVSGSISPAPPPVAYSSYSLSTTVNYWNHIQNAFVPGCATGPDTALQQLTFSLTNSEQGNAASDQVQIVVGSFGALALPNVTVVGTNASLGGTVTFTATVVGPNQPAPTPTGPITWTFSGASPGSPSCASSSLVPGPNGTATATCSVSPALAGTYTATANYSGDTHYTVGGASGTATVAQGNVTLNVSPSASPSPPFAAPGTTLTYVATVTGLPSVPPSGGTVTWTFATGTPAGAQNCGPVTLPTSGPITCQVTGPSPGTFKVTATYSGDPNYNTASQVSTIQVAQGTATVSVTPSSSPAALGSTVTFQASVTGNGFTPSGGKVTWTFPAGTPAGVQTCPAVVLPNNNITCTITGAAAGTFTPTATYAGDPNYPTTPSAPVSVIVNKGQPTITVTGTPGTSGSGNNKKKNITFKVTITGPTGVAPPTGTGAWTFGPSSPGTWSCPAMTLPTTTTCVVTSPQSGTQYTATLTYTPAANDPNYVTANNFATVTAP
jgi:type II secretory pathway pseudopilin PulG